jgi:pyruvate,water dikinase
VSGSGTVELTVADADRQRFALSESQIKQLAKLGNRILDYYGNFPQDIEWALADGKFYVLQSRPVTGVEYSWDADLESWQTLPDDDDIVWSRAAADMLWTGGSTPLFYSFRAYIIEKAWTDLGHRLGILELMNPAQRVLKFHKGQAYMNPQADKLLLKHTWLPFLRSEGSMALQFQPPAWHDEIINERFNYLSFLRMQLHLREVAPHNRPYAAFQMMEEFITTDEWSLEHLPDPQSLEDEDLKTYIEKYLYLELYYNQEAGLPLLLWFQYSFVGLKLMVDKWYDGPNKNAFGELVMGSIRRTKTFEENLALAEFADMVRNSPELDALFEAHEGTAFFDQLRAGRGGAAGRSFLVKYDDFLREHGHRGNEDRDIYYARRAEDPSIDYRSIRTLKSLGAEGAPDPEARERATNARREATFDEVLQNLQRRPLGFLKAEVFKLVHSYVHQWIAIRDDERWSYERYVLGFKLLFREMGRRLVERGDLDSEDDMYFLSKDELYELFDGGGDLRLAKAKIVARRRDHHRVYTRQRVPPMYLRRDVGLPDDVMARKSLMSQSESNNSAYLRATPNSPGTITATARVVRRLEETNRVKQGEIMVCNATDPGWTPVFLIISGVITETGGILAHAACLAREYGLPAVQMPNALQIIPDGATVSIDGSTGQVTMVDSPSVDVETLVESTV